MREEKKRKRRRGRENRRTSFEKNGEKEKGVRKGRITDERETDHKRAEKPVVPSDLSCPSGFSCRLLLAIAWNSARGECGSIYKSLRAGRYAVEAEEATLVSAPVCFASTKRSSLYIACGEYLIFFRVGSKKLRPLACAKYSR